MAITVTMNEVLNAIEGLRWLGQQKLPLPVSYRVMKLMRAVDKEVEEFAELRQKLIITADETTTNEELGSFLKEDVVIEVSPLDINELEKLEISPAHLIGISPFIMFETQQ